MRSYFRGSEYRHTYSYSRDSEATADSPFSPGGHCRGRLQLHPHGAAASHGRTNTPHLHDVT